MKRLMLSGLPFCGPAIGMLLLLVPAPASAQAVRNLAGFSTNVLAANDDGSTALVATGQSMNFFGTTYTGLWVNNNGNVTFTSSYGTYTPTGLISVGQPIIAPFFADVDTRGAGSGLVHYGTDTLNGHHAFGVEWPAVGYFSAETNKLNTFELILIDRTDTGAGNFDIEMNYNSILWETGGASGGTNGLGGTSAAAGYSSGTAPGTYQFPGSLVNGALLNGGPNALISNDLNSTTLGRYLFSVRNGVPGGGTPPTVPVLSPQLLVAMIILLGAASLFAMRKVRQT